MKFDDEFKKRILICRSQIGLTQNELASLIGVAQRMIAAYELGESRPRLKVLMKLSETFGVSPEWLANGLESGNYRENVTSINSRQIPILRPGLADRYIDKSLDSVAIKEHVTIGFEVSLSAFAIKIEDDSMTSSEACDITFPRGAIVVFDPCIAAKGGDYVLVHWRDSMPHVTFRKYYPSLDSISLAPLNKNYPSDVLTSKYITEMDVSIIPAVGVISTLPALSRLKTQNYIVSENENLHQSSIPNNYEDMIGSNKKPT